MKENNHHPHVLKREIVMSILCFALILEVGVMAQSSLVFKSQNYLASILPAVVADLINTQRTGNGLPALTVNPLLTEAAQDKANDEATKGYFAHVSPSGITPWYWFNLVGYNFQYAGENLAVNFTDSDAVVNAWMNSPTHRANILKQQYTETGVGMATGMYEGQSAIFVVQEFATPEGGASSDLGGTGDVGVVPTLPTNTAPTPSPPAPPTKLTTAKSSEAIPPPTELMTTSNPVGLAPETEPSAVPAKAPNSSVLGTETSNLSGTEFALQPGEFQKLLASPFTVANTIFIIIAAFFISVLIAALIYRSRLPRMTATLGAMSLVVVALGFVIINDRLLSSHVQVNQPGSSSITASAAME